ncbi:MAG TPA: hypothetical protein VFP54_01845 [Acidimicrobiales bacterium]|nr:hypothetical protein [Acidimicrobiales bacterium]
MLPDVVVALLITAAAVALGMTVHPVLFLMVIFAVLRLFFGRRTSGYVRL